MTPFHRYDPLLNKWSSIAPMKNKRLLYIFHIILKSTILDYYSNFCILTTKGAYSYYIDINKFTFLHPFPNKY